MTDKKPTQDEPSTLDKILRIEERIEGQKVDILGLFENYLYDFISLHKLRDQLGEEMVIDAFGQRG